jgi:HSP20 family protein
MRTLAPWGGNLKREMERFLDHFAEPVWEPFEMAAGDWAPKLNVSETKDAMVMTAELPGVDPKDIEIALTGDLLTLEGEKEKEKEIRLPMAVDASKVTATFKNGVLVVTLPKTPASKGTMIPVKAE